MITIDGKTFLTWEEKFLHLGTLMSDANIALLQEVEDISEGQETDTDASSLQTRLMNIQQAINDASQYMLLGSIKIKQAPIQAPENN